MMDVPVPGVGPWDDILKTSLLWHFGYGQTASEAASATLGPGSFYTEPAGVAHFAFTGDAPTVVYITGMGRPTPNMSAPKMILHAIRRRP